MNPSVHLSHPCDDGFLRPVVVLLSGVILLGHTLVLVLLMSNISQVGIAKAEVHERAPLYVSLVSGKTSFVSSPKRPAIVEKTKVSKKKETQPSRIIAAPSEENRKSSVKTVDAAKTSSPYQEEENVTDNALENREDEVHGDQAIEVEDNVISENGNGTENDTGKSRDEAPGSEGNGSNIAKSVDLSQIRYKYAVKPVYPSRSIKNREAGMVQIRVLIGVNGKVQDASILSTSGFTRLDKAALNAATNSTFYPYAEDGRPLLAMAVIPYHFNLETK